jgi:hypothetical protein
MARSAYIYAFLIGALLVIIVDISLNLSTYTNLSAYPLSGSDEGREKLAQLRKKTYGSDISPKIGSSDCGNWAPSHLLPTRSSKTAKKLPRHELFASLDEHFERYDEGASAVPTWILTPSHVSTIHRFFDSSPMSPSGRFIAVTRIPDVFKERPGQEGVAPSTVILLDLQNGEETSIEHTKAYGAQLGAQVQWGKTDAELYYNIQNNKKTSISGECGTHDMAVHGSIENITTKTRRKLSCPIYHVSPDGRKAVTPNMGKIKETQYGYGADYVKCAVRDYTNLEEDEPVDGIYVSNVNANICQQIISLKELGTIAKIDEDRPLYGFHTKWSPDSQYLMVVLRSLEKEEGILSWLTGKTVRRQHLFVLRPNDDNEYDVKHVVSWGSDAYSSSGGSDALSSLHGDGNHPNWVQGETADSILKYHKISMNHRAGITNDAVKNQGFQVVVYDIDALFSDTTHAKVQPRVISSRGSGHPTVYADSLTGTAKYILTDAYAKESGFFDNKVLETAFPSFSSQASRSSDTTPLRLVNALTGKEVWLLQVPLSPDTNKKESHELSRFERYGGIATAHMPEDLLSKKHARAWRCDMHPVRGGRNGEWIIFNGRPKGEHRQVMLAYVGPDWGMFFEDT